MKLLACLLFVIATASLQAQECYGLNTKSFFTSVKPGGRIPRELVACSRNAYKKSSNFIPNRFQFDSLSSACRKRYADLFTFMTVPFSFASLELNDKGQIYAVELYSFFDDNRHKDSTSYVPPANYITLFNKIKSLYGEPSGIVEASNTDSLFVKELGMPRLVSWQCARMNLQLRVRYGSQNKELNVLHVQVWDSNFEPVPEVQELLQ